MNPNVNEITTTLPGRPREDDTEFYIITYNDNSPPPPPQGGAGAIRMVKIPIAAVVESRNNLQDLADQVAESLRKQAQTKLTTPELLAEEQDIGNHPKDDKPSNPTGSPTGSEVFYALSRYHDILTNRKKGGKKNRFTSSFIFSPPPSFLQKAWHSA